MHRKIVVIRRCVSLLCMIFQDCCLCSCIEICKDLSCAFWRFFQFYRRYRPICCRRYWILTWRIKYNNLEWDDFFGIIIVVICFLIVVFWLCKNNQPLCIRRIVVMGYLFSYLCMDFESCCSCSLVESKNVLRCLFAYCMSDWMMIKKNKEQWKKYT